MRHLLSAATACLSLAIALTCSAQTASPAGGAPQYRLIPGYDPSAMDKGADPCVDFYQYACGNYSKLHPIPSDLPLFDQFANLFEFNTQALHEIVDKTAATKGAPGTNEQKIGDYYSSCLDTDAIDKRGLAAIQPELDRIAALSSKQDLPALIAHLNRLSVGVFLDYGSQQDFKDATREIAYIDQSGIGLPEKDYYLRTDEKSVETRKQYAAHLANVLKLLGDSPDAAQSEAQKILDLETALAKGSQGNVERRDPDKVYHMMALTSFSPTAPAIDTAKYVQLMGSPSITELNVVSPDFFPALNKAIADTDLGTLKAYMRAHLADSFSMRLPHAFDEESFDFFGRKLTGTPEQQARWKRCVQGTDSALGEALGKLYAAQYFTPDMKASTLSEVHDIEAAMGKDIDDIDWMSSETKVKAKEKLHAVADKIGYPDKWRDYSKLEIKAGDALGNSMRSREFEVAYQLDKIGKPVNRQEWQMTPPTVNAYYDPSMNDINLPASCSPPSTTRMPPMPPTMDTLAQSSATSSRTASTTKAPSSTPTATSTTGGHRRTRNNSNRRPAALPTNTVNSPQSTTSKSTANSPSARTPPIMAACASPSSRSWRASHPIRPPSRQPSKRPSNLFRRSNNFFWVMHRITARMSVLSSCACSPRSILILPMHFVSAVSS